jgi:iodotyrosine deiodinase
MTNYKTQPLDFQRLETGEMRTRADALLAELRGRRSVREFSSEPVPREVLVRCIETAAQAPSGANKQPWTFALVTDPQLKHRIRVEAEREEAEFYQHRATPEWLEDLAPLQTGPEKEFLDVAPALIAVFARRWEEGTGRKHYYVSESAGIACGFLIAALHHAGLVTLTHTPSPMQFLAEILGRPKNESAYLLLPVGYPADGAQVPDIARRPLSETLIEFGVRG